MSGYYNGQTCTLKFNASYFSKLIVDNKYVDPFVLASSPSHILHVSLEQRPVSLYSISHNFILNDSCLIWAWWFFPTYYQNKTVLMWNHLTFISLSHLISNLHFLPTFYYQNATDTLWGEWVCRNSQSFQSVLWYDQ